MVKVFANMVVRMVCRVTNFDMHLLIELRKETQFEKYRKYQYCK
jgi:hypothetical protein